MKVAGIMSGTSLDGIDVAIVDISRARVKTLAHATTPWPAAVRVRILAVSNTQCTTADISRLNFELGELYAKVFLKVAAKHKVQLIGCHGQTVFHEGVNTLQIGEASVIAERTGLPVISDFRTRDIAAGGQGAPLVPFADYLLFRSARINRVALNIGGIANITILPAGAPQTGIIAFDTGPGNMVIDALVLKLFGKRFDRNGGIAAMGKVIAPALNTALRNPYFVLKPPRTAGREEFGREYAAKFLAACTRLSSKPEDAIATATALTAETIATSYKRFVLRKMRAGNHESSGVDYIVSGGGARNHALMAMLAQRLESLGCELAASEDFGMPVEAKEAAAFALLAWQTWHRFPGNVPAATGAKRPAILGQVTYV